MKTIEAYILLRKGTGNVPVIMENNGRMENVCYVALDKATANRLAVHNATTERVVPCRITIDPKYLEKESDDK